MYLQSYRCVCSPLSSAKVPGALYSPSINSIDLDSTASTLQQPPSSVCNELCSCELAATKHSTFAAYSTSQTTRTSADFFPNAIPIVAGSTGSINSFCHIPVHNTLLPSYPCYTLSDAIFAATLGTTTFRLILFLQHLLLESGV